MPLLSSVTSVNTYTRSEMTIRSWNFGKKIPGNHYSFWGKQGKEKPLTTAKGQPSMKPGSIEGEVFH